MVAIATLLQDDPIWGLWHGTRASVNGAIQQGASLLEGADDVVGAIWNIICSSRNTSIANLESCQVTDYFAKPVNLDRAVDIGNSIRFLKNNFEYDVVAFATTKCGALGFSEVGSELGRSVCALIDAARLEYPEHFDEANLGPLAIRIEDTYSNAKQLFQGEPKLFRLIKLPTDGKFYLPGDPDTAIEEFSLPFPGYPLPPEVLFRGTVTEGCWEEMPLNAGTR